MSYNYQTEIPVNNNTVNTVRSLSLEHPDNDFLRGFKEEADLHELEDLLNEVIIRFDTNPDNYLKDDYMHLIALLYRNFLIIKGFNDRVDEVDDIIKSLDVRITKNEGDIITINNNLELLDANTIKVITPISYDDLVTKVNNKELQPGQKYRIIDYSFTTTQSASGSSNKPFDIIVTATSNNTLSENAKAIKRENSTYYNDLNLESWDIKYTIYNNTTLYKWANQTNGKGVIYYMKDEFNNEAGYDFQNALFNGKPTFTQCKNISIAFASSLPFNIFSKSSDIVVNGSTHNTIEEVYHATLEGGVRNAIKYSSYLEIHQSSYNTLSNMQNVQINKVNYIKSSNALLYSKLSNLERVNLEATNAVYYKTIDNVKNTTIEFNQDYINTPEIIRQGSEILTFID